ncbi:MAG: MFS transporter [Nannocystaceae bacterium]|nr:MFS transporter [Nannocystaceae bacterium]
MDRRLLLLGALYFCQGLPGGFLAVALPVLLLQQGVDLTRVGLVSALSLPWMLKVLWSPLVDRYGSARLGRRRSWMLPSLAVMLLATLGIGALDPVDTLAPILLLFFVLNLAAATQDIAVDGYAVSMLRGRELAHGNTAQVGGFKLGNLVGGGVLLAASGVLGWQGVFAIMAACIGAALLAVWWVREPADAVVPALDTLGVVRRALRGIVREPAYLVFLVAAKFGESLGGSLVKPSMVGHGFSRELIGTLDGTFGSLATVAGAAVGGVLARRSGWAVTVAILSTVQGLALVAIGLYQAGEVTPVGYGVRVACENFAGGGVAVAVFVLAMSKCDRDVGGAAFTAAQVVYMAGAAIAGPLGAAIADATAIAPVMVVSGGLAIGVAALALALRARLDAPLTTDPGDGTRSG